ncbi:MAG: ABC transporter ATP-binding protein/permease [Gracilibacteraceae bacterium]|jgi:ATP-binding cassette subfamily B protein|nr:ABC transporter ATP-binding protein/permease [Gracilibacteraceae bacterium]
MSIIRRLLQCIGAYKKDALLAPLFMVGEVVLEVVIPFLMASLIDIGIDGGQPAYIWRMGAVLTVCAAGALVCGVLSGSFAASASAGFARNLRREMFSNIQTFSFTLLDKFTAASLVTRLTSDVTNVQVAFQMLLRLAVRSPLMLALAFAMAFHVQPTVALFFLAVVPVLALGIWFIMGHVHPIFVRVFATYDRLNKTVQENVRGIRVVKSFVREAYEREKFNSVSASIFTDFTRAEKRMAFTMPLMQFCMYACMLLIAWVGARLIVGGEMSAGQLMSMFTYAMQILFSLMMLSMVFVMMIISRASAERITEVLLAETDLTSGPDGATVVPDGAIVFRGVDFGYGGRSGKMCLTGIDLSVAAGETVGILGGTGSGKTSLIQLIPRLCDATAGTVEVGGRDVRAYDLTALRNAVTTVPQKNELFSGTIRENLRWGSEQASEAEMIRACRLAQADAFVRALPAGYDTQLEQGGANLSGGQKQRLCIARALLKQPKILILDDATSAVDMRTDAALRRALREELPAMTRLIIAQRVDSVRDADKIVVLDGGRVQAVGTHAELLQTCRIYQEVCHSQRKGGDFDETEL